MSDADAGVTFLCSGFSDCRSHGFSTHGYDSAWGNMYWRMYSGRNCTNYAAYRMVEAGLPNARPWSGNGNATHWGYEMSSITDHSPQVGSVAWWSSASAGAGSMGHVAVVEHVLSPYEIIVSESNYGSDLSYRRITRSSSYWPTGFIHFADRQMTVTSTPKVSGTAEVGKPLTVSTGGWSPNPNRIHYQWVANDRAIPGAHNKTYHPSASVVGKRLAVVLTGTRRGFGSTSKMSTPTAPISKGKFEIDAQPRILGDLKVGHTVRVWGARYSPTAKIAEVRWYADHRLISKGRSTSLKLTPAMNGKQIGATVIGWRSGFLAKGTYAFSAGKVGGGRATPAPPTPPSPHAPPSQLTQTRAGFVKGGTRLGGLMQVDPGRYSLPAKLSYRWTREGRTIPGATTAKYRPTSADVGHRLSVTVTATAPGHGSVTKTYGPSGRVRVKPTVSVTATGKSHEAAVSVAVTAPGYTPTGTVRIVTNGGRAVTKQLSAGRTGVTFVKLPAGEYVVSASYGGDGVAYWASGGDRTRVS